MSAEIEIAQERREDCRRLVLEHLSSRQVLACHPQDIRRRLNAGRANDFTVEEVQAACVFLVGMNYAKQLPAEMGATLYYQATSAGVLAYERGN